MVGAFCGNLGKIKGSFLLSGVRIIGTAVYFCFKNSLTGALINELGGLVQCGPTQGCRFISLRKIADLVYRNIRYFLGSAAGNAIGIIC